MVQCSAVSNIYRVITTGTVNMELIKLEGNDFGGGERGNGTMVQVSKILIYHNRKPIDNVQIDN